MKSLGLVLGWIILCPAAFAETDLFSDSEDLVQVEEVSAVNNDEESATQLVLTAGETESAERVAEADIPLFDRRSAEPITQKLGSSSATLLTVAIGLILLLGGFFLMRKWVRKTAGAGSPLQIKIIGQHYLGPKKSLAVVRVAGESILIGITDHSINCIKSLSLLEEELPGPDLSQDFGSALKAKDQSHSVSEELENFAVAPLSDIQDRVSTKLRTMREL